MISASDIARALDGHRHGSYWTAKCPAHDDHSPSLSISETSHGRVLVKCFAGCGQRTVLNALRDRGLWPEREECFRTSEASKPKPAKATSTDVDRTIGVQRIWRETLDPRGTWAEDYPASRKLRLPADPEFLLRTLHFHPACPFPDKTKAPALIAAFTPIGPDVPDDPFLDPLPTAIHRIRGKGHDNKKMLGPVKGCAIMISPWWQVHETLHVCEGVETALALYNEGADDLEDCRRPIWALGSKDAIKALPIIHRVHRLVIWADSDANGGGVEAALACGTRWRNAGKTVVIRYPEMEGEDFADWRSP